MFKGNPVIASIAEHLIPATAAIVATRSDRSGRSWLCRHFDITDATFCTLNSINVTSNHRLLFGNLSDINVGY